MDTSPEFIKQCEKAVEIQQVYRDDPNIAFPLFGNTFIDDGSVWGIWLPRQDQLQEMMPQKGMVAQFIVAKMRWWDTEAEERGHDIPFDSWEQFWLGILMHEKYRKTWNGKDWISEQ